MLRLLSLSVIAASAVSAFAQQDELKRTFRLGAETAHIYRGVERSGEGAFAAVDVAASGFSGGLAVHQSLGGDDARELNLGAGYAWKPAETLAIEFSARHFWFGDPLGSSIDRSIEFGVGFAWQTPGGFTPRIGYYRDVELDADTIHASIAHEIALTKWGTYLELSAFGGWSEAKSLRFAAGGVKAGDSYTYFGAEAVVPYRIGEITVISAGLSYNGTDGQAWVWSPSGKGGSDRLAARIQVLWEW